MSVQEAAPKGRNQHKTGGTFLAVQWLGLHASTAGGVGLIPSWGTKTPHVMRHGQKKKGKKKWLKSTQNPLGPSRSKYEISLCQMSELIGFPEEQPLLILSSQ